MGTFPMSDGNSETTFVWQPRRVATKMCLRFSIRIREGVEVAAKNGLVLGGSAWVGVGRRVGRQAAIKKERRLAAFPLKPSVIISQGR